MKIWPTGVDPIGKLSEFLVTLSQEDLRKTILVLPTERLALHVIKGMTDFPSHRGFIAPRIYSLEGFMDAAFEAAGFAPQTVLDPLAQEVLFTRLLSQRQYQHLLPNHSHEIVQLFSSIEEHHGGEAPLFKLKEIIEEDIYRSEGYRDSIVQRVEELIHLYRKWQDLGIVSGFRYRKAQAEKLFGHLVPFWERLIFACFTTVKPFYLPLWQKLSQLHGVEFWLKAPPELLSPVNPMGELLKALSPGGAIPPLPKSPHRATFQIHRCSGSGYFETASALSVARNYIEKGIPPSQIGILIPSENQYAGPLKALLPGFPYEYNLACPSSFKDSPLGRWLFLTLQILSPSWDGSTLDLLAWMAHPVTCWKDALKHQGFILGLHKKTSIQDLLRGLEDEDILRELQGIQTFREPWIRGPKTTLIVWVQKLSQFLRSFGFFEQPDEESTLGALEEIFLAMAGVSGDSLTGGEFLTLLRDKLQSQKIRTVGYPLKGVQILSLAESRFVPFQVVIILGCGEGLFPKALPKDYLVDDYLKERMGLPGWEYVEALEDTSFQLLYHRTQYLELFYSETQVRSRFLERLILEQKTEERVWRDPEQLLGGVSPECPPDGTWLDPDPESRLSPMSATALRDLLQCPYRFLLRRLGVNEAVSFKESTKKNEGRLLHGITQGFFTGELFSKQLLAPLGDSLETDHLEDYFLERFLRLTDEAFAHKKDTPLDLHLRNKSWPKLAQFMAKLYIQIKPNLWQSQFLRHFEEKRFWVEIQLGDRFRVELEGVVDHLSFFSDGYLILDYKRRLDMNPSPQLNFYALALENGAFGKKHSPSQGILGYWSILDGVWKDEGIGENALAIAQSLGLSGKKRLLLEDKIQDWKGLWEERHGEILKTRQWKAEPGDHCGFCPYRVGICRQGVT